MTALIKVRTLEYSETSPRTIRSGFLKITNVTNKQLTALISSDTDFSNQHEIRIPNKPLNEFIDFDIFFLTNPPKVANDVIEKAKALTTYQYQEYAGANYSTFSHNKDTINAIAIAIVNGIDWNSDRTKKDLIIKEIQ